MRSSVALDADVKLFHLFAGPWCFSQEGKTGLDTGIIPETADVDDTSQVLPTEMINEFRHDHFQCLTMKRVFGWHVIFVKQR